MGTFIQAVLGVHLMYRNKNGHILSNDLYEKQTKIGAEVEKLLQEAGVPHPECDFGFEANSDILGVAIGTRISGIDYFSDSSMYHSVLPEVSASQMGAIFAAAELVERLLLETGSFDNFKKTVGLAVHGSS